MLAELLGSECDGAVIHLGSCSVLDADRRALRSFLKATGASALSGFGRDVGWLESAAFEVALLGYLASYQRTADAMRFAKARFIGPDDKLKFRYELA